MTTVFQWHLSFLNVIGTISYGDASPNDLENDLGLRLSRGINCWPSSPLRNGWKCHLPLRFEYGVGLVLIRLGCFFFNVWVGNDWW